KLIGIVIYLILGALFYLIFKGILNKYVLSILSKINKSVIFTKPVAKASGPASVLIVLILIENFLPYLQLPINLSKFIATIIKILYPIFATIIVYRITDIISHIF